MVHLTFTSLAFARLPTSIPVACQGINQLAVFISIGFNHTMMIPPLPLLVFIFDFDLNFVGQRTQIPSVSCAFLCPPPRPPRAWADPRPCIGKSVVGTVN